jgi:hypothetical protein
MFASDKSKRNMNMRNVRADFRDLSLIIITHYVNGGFFNRYSIGMNITRKDAVSTTGNSHSAAKARMYVLSRALPLRYGLL